MPDENPHLLPHWPAGGPSGWCYFWVIVASLLIRALLTFFKAVDKPVRHPAVHGSILKNFWSAFKGFSLKDTDRDCGLPFFLGILEMFCYAFLMSAEAWTFIGAWLGFKVLAQWGHWGKNRRVFNRFLLGTVLTLMCSFLFAVEFFAYGQGK